MERNVFIDALDTLKHIKSQEGNILTKSFLDLCKLLLPLIDHFGPSMSCIKADVAHHILRLESKFASNPSKYSELYTITREEIQSNVARSTSSCTNGFVWLNRAMDFMVHFFSNLLEHADWSMSQVCKDSYKKTLKKWHGWIAISTFKVLIKLVPERKKFMESVGMSSEVNAEIDKLCKMFAPVLEDNHKFLCCRLVSELMTSKLFEAGKVARQYLTNSSSIYRIYSPRQLFMSQDKWWLCQALIYELRRG